MKIFCGVILVVTVYLVLAERCERASSCVGTQCASTTDHAHIQCIEKHCTCVKDPQPCLVGNDCAHGSCIEKDGHTTKFHCLDGTCTCIRV